MSACEPKPDPASEEALDRLLARVPPPEAPAWFETRLKARLLRESAAPRPRLFGLAGLLPARLAWGGLALLAAGLGIFLWISPAGQPSPMAGTSAPSIEDADLAKALDAFASYIQDKPGYVSENEEWLPF
jgi:hypothetical protein